MPTLHVGQAMVTLVAILRCGTAHQRARCDVRGKVDLPVGPGDGDDPGDRFQCLLDCRMAHDFAARVAIPSDVARLQCRKFDLGDQVKAQRSDAPGAGIICRPVGQLFAGVPLKQIA